MANCKKCSERRGSRPAGSAATTVSGTWRVIVNGRQVYEATSERNARAVAERFKDPTILAPGE